MEEHRKIKDITFNRKSKHSKYSEDLERDLLDGTITELDNNNYDEYTIF